MKLVKEDQNFRAVFEGVEEIQTVSVACGEAAAMRSSLDADLLLHLANMAFMVEVQTAPDEELVLHQPFAELALQAMRLWGATDISRKPRSRAYRRLHQKAWVLVQSAEGEVA